MERDGLKLANSKYETKVSIQQTKVENKLIAEVTSNHSQALQSLTMLLTFAVTVHVTWSLQVSDLRHVTERANQIMLSRDCSWVVLPKYRSHAVPGIRNTSLSISTKFACAALLKLWKHHLNKPCSMTWPNRRQLLSGPKWGMLRRC